MLHRAYPGRGIHLADRRRVQTRPACPTQGAASGQFGPPLTFDHSSPPATEWDTDALVACFTSGTLIATRDGPRLIESLCVGDLVLTQDHGFEPLRWIGSTTRRVIDPIRPVRFRIGSLGAGLPSAELMVSPNHGMLVRSGVAAALTGRREVLLPAARLVGLPGVDWATDIEEVTYLHLLFDAHEVVFAEDAPTESLLPRPHLIGSFGAEAEAELRLLFPELESMGILPARQIPDERLQEAVAGTHRADGQPVLQD